MGRFCKTRRAHRAALTFALALVAMAALQAGGPQAALASPPEPGAHNPRCRFVSQPIRPRQRKRIVKACLRDPSDRAAIVLGLHTAMAGDVRVAMRPDARGFHGVRIARYAREVLARPDAEQLIAEAAIGAEDYVTVIHTGRPWTTPENLVGYHEGALRLGVRQGHEGERWWLWLVVLGVVGWKMRKHADENTGWPHVA